MAKAGLSLRDALEASAEMKKESAMTFVFHDRAPLEKVKRLADGRIAAVAKFARSGTYTYSGAEVGRPDLQTVTVYRPADEVFDQASMASFTHKAITIGHPQDAVSADNWKQHSVGYTEGKVARDGDYLEIGLMLADAAAVRAFDAGTRELSAGYTCELVWGDGITPTGEKYQATQRAIRGNHIAVVPQGRAGSHAKIGDNAMQDAAMMTAIDRAHAEHDAKWAFMGDRAPVFDRDRAEMLARQSANSNKATRDAALASRYDPTAPAIIAHEGQATTLDGVGDFASYARRARYL